MRVRTFVAAAMLAAAAVVGAGGAALAQAPAPAGDGPLENCFMTSDCLGLGLVPPPPPGD